MKCIVLAAGYATRLYPLTENFPKPLLKVQGKTILDWIIEDLDASGGVDEYVVVSNHKFYDVFTEWAEQCKYQGKVTMLDDGTVDNEHRLGAVRDIAFAIDSCKIDEPVLVVAGDNLTDFSLRGFLEYYGEKGHTCIMRHYEPSVERLRRTGVIRIDDSDKVLEMQEKPAEPVSNWAVPPFYIYSAGDLELIRKAVENKVCNVDAPGDFIAWLCTQSEVYAYLMPGKRYDIGNLQSYEEICRMYKGME